MFSVASEGRVDSVKARAIVVHVGNELKDGDWSCSKDGKSGCVHLRAAHRYLASVSGGMDAEIQTDKLVWGEPHYLIHLRRRN
jgi:hypothetical protein